MKNTLILLAIAFQGMTGHADSPGCYSNETICTHAQGARHCYWVEGSGYYYDGSDGYQVGPFPGEGRCNASALDDAGGRCEFIEGKGYCAMSAIESNTRYVNVIQVPQNSTPTSL